jgi:hypothetical protein
MQIKPSSTEYIGLTLAAGMLRDMTQLPITPLNLMTRCSFGQCIMYISTSNMTYEASSHQDHYEATISKKGNLIDFTTAHSAEKSEYQLTPSHPAAYARTPPKISFTRSNKRRNKKYTEPCLASPAATCEKNEYEPVFKPVDIQNLAKQINGCAWNNLESLTGAGSNTKKYHAAAHDVAAPASFGDHIKLHDHVSEGLTLVSKVIEQLWSTFEPDSPQTAPTVEELKAFVVSQGGSGRMADAINRVTRPYFLAKNGLRNRRHRTDDKPRNQQD